MTRERFNSIVIFLLVGVFSSLFGAFIFSVSILEGNMYPLFSVIYGLIRDWQSLIVGLIAVSAAYYGAYPVWKQLGYSRHEIIKQKIHNLDSERAELLKFQDSICGSRAARRLLDLQRCVNGHDLTSLQPFSIEEELLKYGRLIDGYLVCCDANDQDISSKLYEVYDLIIDVVNNMPNLDLDYWVQMVSDEKYCMSRRLEINEKVLACAKAYGERIRELRAELTELETRGTP
ncbi:hypothetical protein [Breoghania sp.]|uniref:hypothetical protein n=1 Tax=Breoghania sp. TaxID=2065378 RepID=UPI002AA76956|nr:hypothetical protein [Breoghania sp.]